MSTHLAARAVAPGGGPGYELTGLGPGQEWVWHEDRVQQLLSSDETATDATDDTTTDSDLLFVAGCAANQGKFHPQFDHVILLTAPADVITHRLTTRTTNPYGRQPDELARTLQLREIVEPLLRRGAEIGITTTMPIDQVVATILRHVEAARPGAEQGQPA
ncbi:hypothetical protein ABGB07_27345 [Micromonosporaceae bacterium B7E4]